MSSLRISRPRSTGVFVSIVAASLILTGCGSSTLGTTEAPVSADALLPAAEGTTQYPLTLETPWGRSTLEERPERIATVSFNALDTELVLALGGLPVTTVGIGYDQAPWSREAAGGDARLDVLDNEYGTFPLEEIAAADPDLIVVFGYEVADTYDELSKIAPVLATADVGQLSTADWTDFIVPLGEALDLQDAAAEVVANYSAKVDGIRDENPEFEGTTISYLVYYGDEYGLIYNSAPGSTGARLFESIGFSLPENASQFEGNATVSDELIGEIDADVVVIHDITEDMGSGARIETLTGNPLFTALTAAQNGRVVVTTTSDAAVGWALSSGGPLGKGVALDTLVPRIVEVLG